MSESKYFNYNINNYNKIRDVLRYIYVYGCYCRESFGEKNISIRKFEDEYRRLLKLIGEENFTKRYDNRKKYPGIKYEYYKNAENILYRSFLSKTFTKKELTLHFLILLTLNSQNHPMNADEIVEFLENSFESESEDERDIKNSVYRQLIKLYKNGLIKREMKNRVYYYCPQDNILDQLDENELNCLYNAVCFFSNIALPCVPGYYLKDTIKKYKKFVYKKDCSKEDFFVFRFLLHHQILDDEIVWTILKAINTQSKVSIQYMPRNESNYKSVQVNPAKIILDLKYGRWFLVCMTDDDSFRLYPIHRISEVKLLDSSLPIKADCDLFDKHFLYSWNTSLSANKPVKLILKFSVETDSKYNYLLNKVKKEGREGIIEILDEHSFLYTIAVNDINEMKPWIRSFSHKVEILHCDNGDFKKEIQDEWKELLNLYGTFHRIKE